MTTAYFTWLPFLWILEKQGQYMMIIHMPGYAKNTGDLESPHGKGVPEISNI